MRSNLGLHTADVLNGPVIEKFGGSMRKVWIEAALNGGWSRTLQPGIPDTVEAIIGALEKVGNEFEPLIPPRGSVAAHRKPTSTGLSAIRW